MEPRASRAAKTGGEPCDIAGWRVDPASLRISKEAQTIKLEPKAMAVLDYLACRPGIVATRQELEASVWAGTVVGYDSLSNTIIKLRKAFGDKARKPHIIETITKSGYRLIAEVNTLAAELEKQQAYTVGSPTRNAVTSFDSAPDPAPPGKPSIAVLPFDNMSGDAEQEYFSDGISEDITTDLSRLSGLLVIARNSAFAYKGQNVNIADISRELGVRYLLEGSVRKSGQRVRINAQMIDCVSGGHVWAERYDRDLIDIFTVQDEVTQAIVAA
ncbi:MAG: winged helix-turn-helix domain-containing protein, partial [Gammaproteobacteria bacterium]